MKKYLFIALSSFSMLALAGAAHAQSITTQNPSRVVVNTAAPIFVAPDTTMAPLRVAKEGSALNAIGIEGDWYRVEFQDPQWGRRLGYVQKRHVTALSTPRIAEPPADLTVAEASATQTANQAPTQVAAPQTVRTGTTSTNQLIANSELRQAAPNRGWFDVNTISMRSLQGDQSYALATPKFSEVAAAASVYPALPAANGIEVAGGAGIGGGFGIGLHLDFANYENVVGLGVNVPHPTFFNRFAADGDATTLERQDRAVDINATFVPATPNAVQIRLFAGPTYFHVSQDMVSGIVYDQFFNVFTGANVVDIRSATRKTVSGTTWGFNAGIDAAYFFSRYVGVGGVIRMNRGTVTVDEPLSGGTADLSVGHVTFGGGLRVRF